MVVELVTTTLVSWCFKPSQPQRITSGLSQPHKVCPMVVELITTQVVELVTTTERLSFGSRTQYNHIVLDLWYGRTHYSQGGRNHHNHIALVLW